MVEIWKDIPEFDGLYQASNLGNFRSFNGRWSKEPRSLKKVKKDNGYYVVTLHKDKKQYTPYVHVIIASLFVDNPNPEEFTQVNHMDEDKSNNLPSNLEWCTPKYNSNYGTHNERVSKSKTNSVKTSKPVMNSDTFEMFPSASEVERIYGFAQGNISRACRTGLKAYGYNWKYV